MIAGSEDSFPTVAMSQRVAEAIPGAIKAFQEALDKVSDQIITAQGVLASQPKWAGDPVSEETAQKFDQRTHDGSNAAMTVWKRS